MGEVRRKALAAHRGLDAVIAHLRGLGDDVAVLTRESIARHWREALA
jgi:hypothetical protein